MQWAEEGIPVNRSFKYEFLCVCRRVGVGLHRYNAHLNCLEESTGFSGSGSTGGL